MLEAILYGFVMMKPSPIMEEGGEEPPLEVGLVHWYVRKFLFSSNPMNCESVGSGSKPGFLCPKAVWMLVFVYPWFGLMVEIELPMLTGASNPVAGTQLPM